MRQPLDIAREILQRSDATADQLRYVYRQSHVMPSHELPWAMESLVRNPNCPADIFTELFPKFANHALQNPSWMLFLLEGSFLMHLNRGFVFTTLWEEFSSRPLLEALILHPIPWIAEAARQHVRVLGEAGEGWEEELLTDFSTRLWRDSSLVWVMRAGALPDAINRRLLYPIQQQPLLPQGERQRVLEKIAGQRGTSLATVLAIIHMQNPLQKWAQHPHWERRFALALNPTIKLMKKQLQCDGHRWVRAAARGNGGIV